MTEIRDARPDDLEQVAALDAELFGADSWSRAAMTAEFAAAGETRHVAVAVSDARLAGFAIVLTIADVADLQRIGVARSAQRNGLGSQLLAAVTAHAAAAGCERMLLEVDERNESAFGFYTWHGFREIARRPGYYRAGADALVLARDLPRTTIP